MKNCSLLIAGLIVMLSCNRDDGIPEGIDFKQEMRDFVISISAYAKAGHPGFLVVPQNGAELVTESGEEGGSPHILYLEAIDGNGQEDLFYGYSRDDKPTPAGETAYLRSFLDISNDAGNIILVTDYCSTRSYMDDSYSLNHQAGYISFAADHRELDNIPVYPLSPYGENNEKVTGLSGISNFLYLIDPGNYDSKDSFIGAIAATNYDLLIMDLFFEDGSAFILSELERLKEKQNGGKRLLLAYMSVGEAETYRYYWQADWQKDPPNWLEKENPAWEGNYKVRYWEPEWQSIIFGDESSYLDRILAAGFDGVYLDIIDAFEYFE